MKFSANKYAPIFQTLDFNRFPPSVANLPAALTINGQTVYPTFRYNGKDATGTIWNPWGYGEVLTLQSGTAPTYNNGSPLLGSVDDSVKYSAGGYHQANDSAFSGTPDLWVEMLIDKNSDVNKCIFAKTNTDRASQGISCYTNSGIVFYISDGTHAGYLRANAVSSNIVYVCFAVDMSGDATNGLRAYVNGVDLTITPSAPSVVTNVSSTGKWTVGAASNGASQFDGGVMFLSVYAKDNWFAAGTASPVEWATIAATRFAQLTGSKPIQSVSGVKTLTSQGTVNSTYIQKFENNQITTKLYYMGGTTPRTQEIIDANGKRFRGILSETAATNPVLQNSTFTTSWNTERVSVPATAVVCPDGITRTTVVLHEDGTAGNSHSLYQILNPGLNAGESYVISFYAKALNRGWVDIYSAAMGGTFQAIFNIATGLWTYAGNGVLASGSESFSYDGTWRRAWLRGVGVAGVRATYLRCSSSPGTASAKTLFDGLNQDSFAGFGYQIESGYYPSSLISTTTAAVTRAADSNYYTLGAGDVVPSQGTLSFEFWAPSFTTYRNHYLYSLSDATSANHISLYLENATGKLGVSSASSGGAQTANILTSASMCDNIVHKVILYWSSTSCTLIVDNVVVGTDSTFDAPTVLSRLNIGALYDATLQAGPALVSNLQIYPVPTNRIILP